ncbi:hypothetical protein Q75_03105 [Bacillus coahuilensis p1.1.43]|uniref:Probable membrane transporter protein n=1 Tax=Bacillus coahuilensis p1.1.43 TaxID=1150625 RepID=A0A147KBB9_9BACI|nr:hypothetical protein Q75_03105 [Bacillus coahuilensis p1.1.43]
MIILYFSVALIATVIGALAGVGGGIIIKPVLDLIGRDSIGMISILSASTIFSMSVVSLIHALVSKRKVNLKLSLLLSTGAIMGGVIGKKTLDWLVEYDEIKELIGNLQSGILAFIMLLILVYFLNKQKINSLKINKSSIVLLVGLVLGVLSAFLSIGGGPLNIAILSLLFGMRMEAAVIHSILIIFFSQGATVITAFFSGKFAGVDWPILVTMVIGGLSGGFIGSWLLNRLPENVSERLFSLTIFSLVLLNVFNLFF